MTWNYRYGSFKLGWWWVNIIIYFVFIAAFCILGLFQNLPQDYVIWFCIVLQAPVILAPVIKMIEQYRIEGRDIYVKRLCKKQVIHIPDHVILIASFQSTWGKKDFFHDRVFITLLQDIEPDDALNRLHSCFIPNARNCRYCNETVESQLEGWSIYSFALTESAIDSLTKMEDAVIIIPESLSAITNMFSFANTIIIDQGY